MKKDYKFQYWWSDGSMGGESMILYPLTNKNFNRLVDAYKSNQGKGFSKCEEVSDLYNKIMKEVLNSEADTYLEDECLLEELFDYDENIDYEEITIVKVRNQLKRLYEFGIHFPEEVKK